VTLATAVLIGVAHVRAGRPTPADSGGAEVDVAAPPVPDLVHRRRADPAPLTPLRVVGLGDSVTAGSACRCTPFLDLYARTLASRTARTVQARNLGVPGQTSAGLLASLTLPSAASTAVRRADVVTITIGANDLDPEAITGGGCTGDPGACYRDDIVGMARDVGRVLDRIRVLRGSRPTTLQVTGYWDVWQDGSVGRSNGFRYVSAADILTRLTNAALAGVAAEHGASYVDLFVPFRGPIGSDDDTGLLAPDGDHPDARGHLLIATALAADSASAPLARQLP